MDDAGPLVPTISYTPSEADLIEANRLWFRRELRRGGNLLFFFCGGWIFGLVGWHFGSDAGFDPLLAFGAGILVWLAGLFLILANMRRQIPKRVRREFAEQRALRDEVELSWSDDGLTATTAHGHSQFGWDEFRSWTENEAVFLLFHAERLFTVVPKRALSEDQVDELRRLLSR